MSLISRVVPLFAVLGFALSSMPANAQTFVDVAVADFWACGLTDEGAVVCANDVRTERYVPPENLPAFEDITIGQQHGCGLTADGEAVCWGGINFYNEQDVPSDINEPLLNISAGSVHSCAVGVSGQAYCWGLSTNGQLEVPGDGFGENGLGFLTVDADETTSCGIELDGSISCWSNDPFILDTRSLVGPFTDLDLSRRAGCGLQASGDIQCWGVGAFDPPNNGPYTDVVASPAAICGIDQNQMLDCSFNPAANIDQASYNTQTQFTAIEGLRSGISIENNLCGLTVDGDITCPLITSLAGEPGGEVESVPVTDQNLGLTAAVYGFNNVELFWTPLPSTTPQTLVEIFRNDELVDTTDARFSWFDIDVSLLGSDPVTYRIRAVSSTGDTGPFSNTITVDVQSAQVTGDESGVDVPSPSSAGLIEAVNFITLGGSYLVTWDAPVIGSQNVAAYEIRRNNTVIDLTTASFYVLDFSTGNSCDTITVSAVSAEGIYLDHRSSVGRVFASNRASDNCTNP